MNNYYLFDMAHFRYKKSLKRQIMMIIIIQNMQMKKTTKCTHPNDKILF